MDHNRPPQSQSNSDDLNRPPAIAPYPARIDYKALAARIDTLYTDPRWDEEHARAVDSEPPKWFDERDAQTKEAERAEEIEEARLYGDEAVEEVASQHKGSKADDVRRIWHRYVQAGYQRPESASSAGNSGHKSVYLSPYERLQTTTKARGDYVDPKSVEGEILRRVKLKAVYAEIDALADVAEGEVFVDILEKAPVTARAAQKFKITKFLGGKLLGEPPVTASEYMDGHNNHAVDQTPLVSRERVGGWLLPRRINTGETTPEGMPIYAQDKSIPSVNGAVNLVIDWYGRSWHQGYIAEPAQGALLTVGVKDDWKKGDSIIDSYSLDQLRQLKYAVRALKEDPLYPIANPEDDSNPDNGNPPADNTPTTPIPPLPPQPGQGDPGATGPQPSPPRTGSTASGSMPPPQTPPQSPPHTGSTASSAAQPPRPRRRATRPAGNAYYP